MKRGRDVFVLVVCLIGLPLALVGAGQGQESCWNMGTCPSGYYNTNSTPVEPCNASSTTNVSTPTTEAASTTGDTTITTAPTPPSVSTTSTIHPTTSTAAAENVTVEVKVMCLKCDSACSTCNGSGPQNCIKCAQEYEKNNSAACAKKQEPKKDELNIVLIAGAAAGGFVVVVLVVVLLSCCVCRRRRRRRNREEDGEGLQSVRPDSTAEVPAIEDKDSAEPSGVSVKREGFEPTYQNVPKAPRPESIERGHDKVTRYTRDPTVKNLRPVIERSNTEEQELQQLPPAPVPPPGARKKSMEPPLEQYEIVEVGQENHQPRQRAATAYPKQHGHPHPGRGPRRQTDPGNGAFPYPSGGVSEPTLPSHTTTRSPRERPLSEAPEDDYENMLDETGKKKNFHKPPAVPEPSNGDSDLDDYENTGPKGSLIPRDRKGRQQGHDIRGVDLDEKPQAVYANQEVFDEFELNVDDAQPVFSPDWQFSQHISITGGRVQGDQSDVILDIPQDALSQEQVVEIRGAVCTSLDEVHMQLNLPKDEYIVSPVVEYFAGPGFRSQKAMRVVMPHFLHPAFSHSSVKVYHFRRDPFGSVVCEPVLRVERDDLKYRRPAASSQVYVLAENRHIHVLTNHFSGYFCTDCGQEYPPPELLLEVHAKHVEQAGNKTMAAVRLDVWDSRFNIRDFRENRTDKDSVNYSDMQLIDCKTLPALGTEHDLTTISLGARLELMSEEDERVWMHCVRRNAEPLYPVFTTIQMKRLVPCTCRTRIPQRVDWQLTNQNEAAPGEVFECLIDIGYVASDLQRADHPERFMSDPRHVTIDVRVKKSSKSDASNKTTATATDYVGGPQGQKPRNNILQPNTVSPTTLQLFTQDNNQSEAVPPEVPGAEGGVQSLCTGNAGLGACADTSHPIIVQNAKHFSLMLGQSANSTPSMSPSLNFNSPFHSPAQVSQTTMAGQARREHDREQLLFQRTGLWRHPDGSNTISADPVSMMVGDPVLRNGTGGETGLNPTMFNERGSAEHAGRHDSLVSNGHVSVPIPVTEAENGLRPPQVCEDERESWGKLV